MKVKLMNGDCLIKMKLIPDNSIDSIVTDPPLYVYNSIETERLFKIRNIQEKIKSKNMKIVVVVNKCLDCPFYYEYDGIVLECKIIYKEIKDENNILDDCPLKNESIIIELKK